jgi:hypothetical protein
MKSKNKASLMINANPMNIPMITKVAIKPRSKSQPIE